MRATVLLAAAVTSVAALPGAAAALADPPIPTEVVVLIGPDEVEQGTRFTLTGMAGLIGRKGNAGRVDLYFIRMNDESARETLVGSVRASDSGDFRATLTAGSSGYYKARYLGNKQRKPAYGSDHLAAYVSSTADRTVYTWSSSKLQCHPQCGVTGRKVTLGPGPVKVTFTRACVVPKAGGAVGFTADPAVTTHRTGDPGWRSFPEGTGPAAFELNPVARTGHFHVGWTSPAAARPGDGSGCDLALTATQRSERKRYV